MKKWNVTMRFALYMDYEVEAENYEEVIRLAGSRAENERDSGFILDSLEFTEIALHDYEELPDEEPKSM